MQQGPSFPLIRPVAGDTVSEVIPVEHQCEAIASRFGHRLPHRPYPVKRLLPGGGDLLLFDRSERLVSQRGEIARPVPFHVDTDFPTPGDRWLAERLTRHDPVGSTRHGEKERPQRGKGQQRCPGSRPSRGIGPVCLGRPAGDEPGGHRVADARDMKISVPGRFLVEHGSRSDDVWQMMRQRSYHDRFGILRRKTCSLQRKPR